jgi:hypothetical protein
MIYAVPSIRWLRRSVLATSLAAAACTGMISGGESPGTKPTTPDPQPGAGGNGGPMNNGTGGAGGGSTTTPPVPEPTAGCGYAPRRIWALTPDQYARTIRGLLPAVKAGEGLSGTLAIQEGFSNAAGRLDMTEPHVGQLLQTAWEMAGEAATDPAKLAPCLGQATVAAACVRDFITSFAGRAFRRDLVPAEIDAFATHFQKQAQAGDAKFAVQQLLAAILTSPNTLYRTELGPEGATGAITLTPFEKASALSYFLTDGPPDAELLGAARNKGLETKVQIEAHTRRLLARPENAVGVLKLFHETFALAHIGEANKDEAKFPVWKPELIKDLTGEADAFIKQVLWGEGSKLSTLLTANFSMLNGRLATYYGTGDPAAGETFRKVTWPAGQRAGILTQAGHNAAFAKDDDTDAVARGKFIREVLLCQAIPPPPKDVNAVPPPPDGKNTQRERLAQHSSDATCSGCHSLMDPLGLAFESYDTVGKYRTMDVGKNLDTSGMLIGAEPEGAPYKNAIELVNLLAKSPTVAKCFVETAFRYANGRDAVKPDACTVERLVKRFDGTGGDVIDLAVGLTTDDGFFARANN